MAGRGTRIAALALAGILAMLIAPAAHASVRTAGGLKYVTKTVELESPGLATATAPCPRGTRTIGGGERNGASVDEIRLAQSFPYDGGDKGSKPDDGWRVRVDNASGSTRKVKVGAVCGDAKVEYIGAEFGVAPTDQTGQVVATCPSDMFALSGGVEAGKDDPIYIHNSFPADPSETGATAWSTAVDNTGGESSATLHVICAKRKPKISLVLSEIQPGMQGSAAPTCPAGRVPYGGGLGGGAGYLVTRVNSLGPLGTGAWLVALDSFAGGPVTLSAYIVCGRPLN